ncbi:MAG: histidine kinase [Cyclobacteriaceae bacterium]|nr:histidine kinase [Cyclobacteriaceae bacterium]
MFSTKYRLVFILLLSIYSFLNILFTVGNGFFDFNLPDYFLLFVLTSVVIGVWELNRLLANRIPEKPKLSGKKIHPLVLQFFGSIFIVVAVSWISLELLYLILNMPLKTNPKHFTLLLAFGFRVNLFLQCVNAIVFYMNQLKEAQLQAEQYKQQTAEANFQILRNQINPHFLFNSFNVLSTLVYKDPDTSSRFIEQLSFVYRYLLASNDKKLVTLQEEMAFMDAYLYLLSIRFGNNLQVSKQVSDKALKNYVAPATLQLLVENVIKHNVVSKKEILTIEIEDRDNFLYIQNSIRAKQDKEPSTQVGLQNIKNRYAFLTDRKVIIENTGEKFKVGLPLLIVEKHEYSNR